MYISALVLDGFKSFGRPTRIPFYEDFTVITGPNGSGKSNIIDGVLFALGLARTRGIRAEKLTDLIYNPGHDGEESAGGGTREASVTVILDNRDGTLSREQVVSAAGTDRVGDVDEITIKRRVKQTEDNYYSYYYLNERSVNLGDIQDLLAQAGIAPEGYNVVMQGDVTEIINMSAFQRRGIIDEIAGVAEFDEKKQAAFEELDAVKERINEATLRIEEKQERLDQLADERDTALEYQSLREEKTEYEGYLKAAELEDKRAQLDGIEADIAGYESTREERQIDLDTAQGRLDRLEAELDELNREIERKGEDEQLAIKREIEEIKGEIDRLDGRIENAEARVEDAENERRGAFVQIDRKQEQLDDIEATIRELKVEKASVKGTIQSKQADLAEVQTQIENVDTEFDELKSELSEKKERLEALKTAGNDAQREKDRLLDDARRRSTEVSDAHDELEAAHEKLPDLKAELSELHSELNKAQTNKQKIEETIETLRAEREATKTELDEVEADLREKQSEYADLEARASSNGDSSWPRAVTTILNSDIDGVHGAVGDLGSVDGEYATACETAAGGRLANVVVADDGVGSECISSLKSRNAGRATFLPITKMDDRGLPNLPNHPGVVDFARNLVEYDDRFSAVFSYVLGSTLVVEEMSTARDLMGDFRMVTLDGDLVERSGAMTGGSGGGSRYAFSQSGGGKLERIAQEIAQLEDKRRTLDDEIREFESNLDAARDRKSDATDTVRAIETDIERTHEQIDDAEARVEALEDRLDEIEAEREAVTEEMETVDERLDEIEAEREAVDAAIESLEADLADSKIPELTAEADALRDEIRDHESRMDDLDGRLNEQQLEKQYTEEAIDDLHDTVETAQNRKADAEEQIADLESEIEDREVLLADKREAIEALESELVDLKADREGLKSAVTDAKDDRDGAKQRVSAIESKLESAREQARPTAVGDRRTHRGGRRVRPRRDSRARRGRIDDRALGARDGGARTGQHARDRGVRRGRRRPRNANRGPRDAHCGTRRYSRPDRAVRITEERDVHAVVRRDQRVFHRHLLAAFGGNRRTRARKSRRPIRRWADDESPTGGQADSAACGDVGRREIAHCVGVYFRHPAAQPCAILCARRDRRLSRCGQRRTRWRDGRRTRRRRPVRRRLTPLGTARTLRTGHRRHDAGRQLQRGHRHPVR